MCMLHNHHDEQGEDDSPSAPSVAATYKTPLMLVGLGVAAVVGYYLWIYHSQHVLAVLPFVFFLACPLMHLLMHRNHGHRHQAKVVVSRGKSRQQLH